MSLKAFHLIFVTLLTSLSFGCATWAFEDGSTFWGVTGIVAGILSYGSSWLVIWALTLAPMALVSALRETSIVFAVIIGVVVLHERLSLMRLASIATTLIGTTILKMNR